MEKSNKLNELIDELTEHIINQIFGENGEKKIKKLQEINKEDAEIRLIKKGPEMRTILEGSALTLVLMLENTKRQIQEESGIPDEYVNEILKNSITIKEGDENND